MKKYIAALIILLMLPVTVFAHSGNTDSNGGHKDGSDYHYHHGYPAHDHYDMDGNGTVDCPYDFDDRTGWNSGSNTDKNKSTSTTSSEKKTSQEKKTKPVWPIILQVFIAAVCLGTIALLVKISKEKSIEIELLKDQIDFTQKCCNEEIEYFQASIDQQVEENTKDVVSRRNRTVQALQARCNRKDHEIQDLLSTLHLLRDFYPQSTAQSRLTRSLQRYGEIQGKNISIPDDVVFINGRYPVKGNINEDRPFGDYTIFIADKGHVYHSKRWCGSTYSLKAKHIFEVTGPIRPCKNCGKPVDLTIPEWYIEFRNALPYLHSGESRCD